MKKTFSIILSLLASLFIYVFYRSDKTWINEIIKLIFSFDRYASFKDTIRSMLPLHEVIIYSLPGGLWIFFSTALAQDFYVQIRHRKLPMAYVPIVFAIGLELFQLLNLVRGRFDAWDVAFYMLFWLAASSGLPGRASKQDILSPFTVRSFICLACFFSVFLAHVNQ